MTPAAQPARLDPLDLTTVRALGGRGRSERGPVLVGQLARLLRGRVVRGAQSACPRREFAAGAVCGGNGPCWTVRRLVHSQALPVPIFVTSAIGRLASARLALAARVGADSVRASWGVVERSPATDPSPVLSTPAVGIFGPRAAVVSARWPVVRDFGFQGHDGHVRECDQPWSWEAAKRRLCGTSSVVPEPSDRSARCLFTADIAGNRVAAGPAAGLHDRAKFCVCAGK